MMDCFWVIIYSSGQLAEHTWRTPSGANCWTDSLVAVRSQQFANCSRLPGGEAYGN
jgi:hypothetical protein